MRRVKRMAAWRVHDARAWLLWLGACAVATLLLLTLRPRLDKAHVALIYLVVVLLASARAGRLLGLTVAAVTFLCFDFFFLRPYHTFIIADPLDWLVLITYLITAVIAAQLFYRAQTEALAARQRASEIERLSTLGAETLNVGRAEDALVAIANVFRTTLHVKACEVYVKDPQATEPQLVVRSPRTDDNGSENTPPLVTWVANEGLAAAEMVGHTTRLEEPHTRNGLFVPDSAQSIMYPLRVRGRTVGVLRLVAFDAIEFEPSQLRFIEVLSNYAALGVERARLIAAAEHAAALAEADKLRDALLAAVSHDLRTPLTTIKATAQEIARTDPRAIVIEDEADRLNRIVADLLTLSRLQGGAIKMDTQVNTAEDLIGAALQQTSGILHGRPVRTNIIIEDNEVLAGRFDFVHSLRVLSNLIENAHKYSPPDQPIEIGARRDGGMIVFSVADLGPGIPNEERHLIYQPFYRSKTAPAGVNGTGLGLAIANRLAELQGGVLRHMPRPGGGTIFVYRVPVAETGHPT